MAYRGWKTKCKHKLHVTNPLFNGCVAADKPFDCGIYGLLLYICFVYELFINVLDLQLCELLLSYTIDQFRPLSGKQLYLVVCDSNCVLLDS